MDSSSHPNTAPCSLVALRAGPEDRADWDRFVNQHPEGRFCHLWGFREVVEKTYGYHAVYLKFLWNGAICGVFPAVRHPRRNGWLISQPFNEYGGPLTIPLSQDQYRELTRAMLEAGQEEGCRAIEVRGGLGSEEAAEASQWLKQPLHSYAVLPLQEPERLWREALTNEARKGVNKARKSGLVAEVRRGTEAVREPFFNLYLDSMKRLGVPPHSRKFFENLAAGLGEQLVAAWVMFGASAAGAVSNARPVAVLLGAVTGRRVHIFVIASDTESWAMRPSDLAHWELISWAYRQGMTVFDFGSVRYAGQIQFKKKWGVAFHDYCFYLIAPPEARAGLSVQTVHSSSRSMTAMSNLWRWAMPMFLARRLGPPIRKYLTK